MSPGAPPALTARRARVLLVVAIALFVAQGWVLTNEGAVFNEELSLHAAPPSRQVVITGGTAHVVDLCGDDARLVFADRRPSTVLCVGGLAWPVLVTPYIGGVHYWPLQLLRPLHRGNPVALRRAALSIGVLGLIALFLLVERVGDPGRAAMAVCVAAVLPILLVVQTFGVLYEELPAILLITAAAVVARRPAVTAPPSGRRSFVTGAVAGLALFANIKAVIVGVPLLVIALYESAALRRTPWRAWLAAVAGGALAIAPLVIAAVVDPQQRVGREVGWRLSIAASRMDVRLVGTELFHLLVNAADFEYYLDLGLGGGGRLWPVTLAVPGAAFVYALASLGRALRRVPHDRVAAACGAVQLFYLVFVWFSYNQTLATNYTPVAFSFAAAIGCTAVAVAEWATRHGRRSGRWLAATLVIAVAMLAANMYRRVDLVDAPISLNAHAARELGAHLGDGSGAPIVVTSNNLVGLPEALTGRSSLRLDVALSDCGGLADEDACARGVLGATIDALPGARFLVPLRTGTVDKPLERRMLPLLESAAAATHGHLREEAHFTTRSGVPVLALLTVERGDAGTPAR